MSRVLAYVSDLTIPLIILLVVGYGYLKKEKVYEAFLDGAEEGLKIVVKLVPTLVGLMVAVSMLRASGLFEGLEGVLSPLTNPLSLPASLLPLLVVKLFSSSAATVMTFIAPVPASIIKASIALIVFFIFYTLSFFIFNNNYLNINISKPLLKRFLTTTVSPA